MIRRNKQTNLTILEGKTDYLKELKPLFDPVYDSTVDNDFVSFARDIIVLERKVPVANVLKAYIKRSLRMNIAKRDIIKRMKPFLKTKDFNCNMLSQYLNFIIVYKDLKSSIVYAEVIVR